MVVEYQIVRARGRREAPETVSLGCPNQNRLEHRLLSEAKFDELAALCAEVGEMSA